jgi:murein L,D-transpeptidase YcbB/YkuD
VTKENSYSDLFLDSAAIENYITKESIAGDQAAQIREFYTVRNNQAAWFTSTGITEQGRGLWSLYSSQNGQSKNDPGKGIKTKMDSLLLDDSISVLASDTSFLRTEISLTAQLVQLASANNSVINENNIHLLVPRKKMEAMQWADSLLTKQKDSTIWSSNPQYAALKISLQQYYNAAKAGGWQPIPSISGLKKGSKSSTVSLLKKRLAATGDYPETDTSNLYTDSLITAIKSAQEQYGFTPNGIVTDSFLKELNVPVDVRLQQILVNMNRAMWAQPQTDSNKLVVNIPSLQLAVYEGSHKVMEMPVIVGKEGTGTMVFSGTIDKIVFSPYWNLPQSIVQNEIKPAMKNDPGYLKKRNMEIVKQDDSMPKIRQLPGKDNALGRVKFLFPNSFDIYLHDTPNKELFSQTNRALSHGCIRVAKPDSLAHYLLRSQPEWTPEKVASAMNSGKEQSVAVKTPLPVAITYYTTWVDERGRMNFRKDVYGHDKTAMTKMFSGVI